jgi:hypothetical protein
LIRHGPIAAISREITDSIESLSNKQEMHSKKYLDQQDKKVNDKSMLQKI